MSVMSNTPQNGWLKLFYRLLDWEWYGDPNMVALFVHLLLRANYRPVRRKGQILERGTLLTSREELARETGISERTIRTCLNRLKSTNEVTGKTTSHGTLLTICNYDKYQGESDATDQRSDQQTDRQVTSDRPTSDQQVTSAIYNKNIKNIRNKDYVVVFDITCARFYKDFFAPERRAVLEQLCMARGYGTIENLQRLASAVLAEWEALELPAHRDISDARQHLINSCSLKLASEQRQQQSQQPDNTNPNNDSKPNIRDYADDRKQRRAAEYASHIASKLGLDPGSDSVHW